MLTVRSFYGNVGRRGCVPHRKRGDTFTQCCAAPRAGDNGELAPLPVALDPLKAQVIEPLQMRPDGDELVRRIVLLGCLADRGEERSVKFVTSRGDVLDVRTSHRAGAPRISPYSAPLAFRHEVVDRELDTTTSKAPSPVGSGWSMSYTSIVTRPSSAKRSRARRNISSWKSRPTPCAPGRAASTSAACSRRSQVENALDALGQQLEHHLEPLDAMRDGIPLPQVRSAHSGSTHLLIGSRLAARPAPCVLTGLRWKRGLRAVGEADDLVDGIEVHARGRFHDIGGRPGP